MGCASLAAVPVLCQVPVFTLSFIGYPIDFADCLICSPIVSRKALCGPERRSSQSRALSRLPRLLNPSAVLGARKPSLHTRVPYTALDPHSRVPDSLQGTRAQRELVIGGEAAMWGEFTDASNALPKTWPDAAAVAERLWAPQHVRCAGLGLRVLGL